MGVVFMCDNFRCINRNVLTGKCSLTECVNHQFSNVIILPQTIAGITFYTTDQLYTWIESHKNMVVK